MAKFKTVEDIQNSVLGNFTRTIRNHERSQRNGGLTVEEKLIQSSPKSVVKQPQPRISFYNPNNPLNGFRGKSLDERKAIMAMIKADKKK